MGQKLGDHWGDLTPGERKVLLHVIQAQVLPDDPVDRSHLTLGMLPFINMNDALRKVIEYASFGTKDHDEKMALLKFHVKLSELRRIIVPHERTGPA